MISQALVPVTLRKFEARPFTELIIFLGGLLLLIALARMVIVLPFTPVPITGQTLGVALIALSFGRLRGAGIVLGYLALGGAGLPVFAGGASGLFYGSTSGYLAGMLIAAFVMGYLADRGWTKNFLTAWLAAIIGGVITLGCGALVLKMLMPTKSALALGVLPFLAGDVIKNLVAAAISWGLRREASSRS